MPKHIYKSHYRKLGRSIKFFVIACLIILTRLSLTAQNQPCTFDISFNVLSYDSLVPLFCENHIVLKINVGAHAYDYVTIGSAELQLLGYNGIWYLDQNDSVIINLPAIPSKFKFAYVGDLNGASICGGNDSLSLYPVAPCTINASINVLTEGPDQLTTLNVDHSSNICLIGGAPEFRFTNLCTQDTFIRIGDNLNGITLIENIPHGYYRLEMGSSFCPSQVVADTSAISVQYLDYMLTAVYRDWDGDGFGSKNDSLKVCTNVPLPEGYVLNNQDCNDFAAHINPAMDEVPCNGIDDNCNGIIDENNPGMTTYYQDADGDGYGNPEVCQEAETQPEGYVNNNLDCDDTDPDVHPRPDMELEMVKEWEVELDEPVGFLYSSGDNFYYSYLYPMARRFDVDNNQIWAVNILDYLSLNFILPGVSIHNLNQVYVSQDGRLHISLRAYHSDNIFDLLVVIDQEGTAEIKSVIDYKFTNSGDEYHHIYHYNSPYSSVEDGYFHISTEWPGIDCSSGFYTYLKPNKQIIRFKKLSSDMMIEWEYLKTFEFNLIDLPGVSCTPSADDLVGSVRGMYQKDNFYYFPMRLYCASWATCNYYIDSSGIVGSVLLKLDLNGNLVEEIYDWEERSSPFQFEYAFQSNNYRLTPPFYLQSHYNQQNNNTLGEDSYIRINKLDSELNLLNQISLPSFSVTGKFTFKVNENINFISYSDTWYPIHSDSSKLLFFDSGLNVLLSDVRITDPHNDLFWFDHSFCRVNDSVFIFKSWGSNEIIDLPRREKVSKFVLRYFKDDCDGKDNNCNGLIDEDGDPELQVLWYRDADGDGWGDPENYILACGPPEGYVENNHDCNDSIPGTNEDLVWYKDTDGDGYSDGTVQYCVERPAGYKAESELIQTSGDCDDNNPMVNPGMPEICNNIDDNCNGEVDEDFDKVYYYYDGDGDGFGRNSNPLYLCDGDYVPPGYVTQGGDCNDANPDIHPETVWYRDMDYDGYSDMTTITQCQRLFGYKLLDEILEGTDCDDEDFAVNPGAPELCNGIDDDCNAIVDDLIIPISSPWLKRNVGRNIDGNSWRLSCENLYHLEGKRFTAPGSTNDANHNVLQTSCMPFGFTVKIQDLDSSAMAGIVIREDTKPGAKKVAIKKSYNNRIIIEYREQTDAPMISMTFNTTHSWMKVFRNAEEIKLFTSHDGEQWVLRTIRNLPMNACVMYGMYIESLSSSAKSSAKIMVPAPPPGLFTEEETIAAIIMNTPPNDNCEDAVILTSQPTCNHLSGTTIGATEYMPGDACGWWTNENPEDVWYSFTADGESEYTIQVDAVMDASIRLYDGSCGNLNFVDCVDNSWTGLETLNTGILPPGVYYVRVMGWEEVGDFTICLIGPAGCEQPEVECDAGMTLCINNDPIELTQGFPEGGVYSGQGVSDGFFDPNEAGYGSHTITYTYSNDGCENTCSFQIIIESPDLQCPQGLVICSNGGDIDLNQYIPEEGIFNGPGVTDSIFDPMQAGEGMHVITFEYTDGEGCSSQCSFTITVTDFPIIPVLNNPYQLCHGDTLQIIPVSGNADKQGQVIFTFDQESIEGFSIDPINFMSAVAGVGSGITQPVFPYDCDDDGQEFSTRMQTNGWTSTQLQQAIDMNQYLEFSFIPLQNGTLKEIYFHYIRYDYGLTHYAILLEEELIATGLLPNFLFSCELISKHIDELDFEANTPVNIRLYAWGTNTSDKQLDIDNFGIVMDYQAPRDQYFFYQGLPPESDYVIGAFNADLYISPVIKGYGYDIWVNYFDQNGCASEAAFAEIEVIQPTAEISGNNELCIGETLNLQASSDIGTMYYWTGPNEFESTAQQITLPDLTREGGGVYSLVVNDGECESDVKTINVYIGELEVWTESDFASGSLRRALYCATDGDEIYFDPSIAIVVLEAPLQIDKNVTINDLDDLPVIVQIDFSLSGFSGAGYGILNAENNTLYLKNIKIFQNSNLVSDAPIIENKGNMTVENVIVTGITTPIFLNGENGIINVISNISILKP